MAISIFTFPVGLYQCNCTIVVDDNSKEAIIIDPGSEPEKILHKIKQNGLQVKYLIHTHAHLDHFGATKQLKDSFKTAEIVLHKEDLFLYELHREQAQMLQLPPTEISPVDHFAEHQEEFHFGLDKLQAIFTPGHSPGSTCFKLECAEHQIIFSGDTLFKSSIGRTDLPGGNSQKIVNSIKSHLYTLDGDFVVVPGHGPSTSIGFERKHNMFVRI